MFVKRSGQTMLELVIASGVISISVIAALTLITKTIDLAQQSQKNVEAGNYAREGIEIVRMIRDSNWLDIDDNVSRCSSPTLWDSDGNTITPCNRLNGSYIATFSTSAGWKMVQCSLATCSGQNTIYRNGAVSTQSLNPIPGATSTEYQRTIVVTPATETVTINSTSYILSKLNIAVTVSQRNGKRPITMRESLYNWR